MNKIVQMIETFNSMNPEEQKKVFNYTNLVKTFGNDFSNEYKKVVSESGYDEAEKVIEAWTSQL